MDIQLLDYNLIEVSDKLRRQCLDALRKLCGRNRILPKSFVLPVDTVRQTSDEPVAYGGFADVYQGQFGGSEVALKVLRIHKDATNNIVQEEMATFCREAVVWKRLRHPNITPFIGIDETSFPSRIAIVCKWMPYGTVAAYLSRHRAANRPKLSLDVARGLEYLHGMNILHGDLKSANILVDEQEMACLADFGLAALFHTSKAATFSTVAGSTRWVAPELFDPEQFGLEKAENTPRSDVYALSMVIWEIFTGRIPFDQHKRDATVMLHVLRGARPQRPAEATPLGLSDDVWALMEGCWDAKWQNRPPLAMTVKRLEEVAKQFSGGTAPIEWPLPL
ncbi:kinase-like protein [Obba rivulosa]|uniref:Kinase-like protein n=1 Tax=Obba rivulosa TaxID=1052685 RepID=A0A8E2DI81_9APHY|nr:kinase-like protein [Obba rivulosa]